MLLVFFLVLGIVIFASLVYYAERIQVRATTTNTYKHHHSPHIHTHRRQKGNHLPRVDTASFAPNPVVKCIFFSVNQMMTVTEISWAPPVFFGGGGGCQYFGHPNIRDVHSIPPFLNSRNSNNFFLSFPFLTLAPSIKQIAASLPPPFLVSWVGWEQGLVSKSTHCTTSTWLTHERLDTASVLLKGNCLPRRGNASQGKASYGRGKEVGVARRKGKSMYGDVLPAKMFHFSFLKLSNTVSSTTISTSTDRCSMSRRSHIHLLAK